MKNQLVSTTTFISALAACHHLTCNKLQHAIVVHNKYQSEHAVMHIYKIAYVQ